jgi:copper chaperone CopZ
MPTRKKTPTRRKKTVSRKPAGRKPEKRAVKTKTEGEEITMEEIALIIPAMYADHHITNVKRLLMPIPGVENVIASSAFKEVLIEFDKSKTTQDALVKALTDAGYAPGELEVIERNPDGRYDPAWEKLGIRATTTNPVDLQLSGEFRKY